MSVVTEASVPTGTVSLCLLTWNELAGCQHDVPRLPLTAFDEVFAVDGGSTDGTVEFLTQLGIVVHRQPRKGYNQAYLHAFATCTSEALVLFHPKGSIDPSEVLRFRPLFDAGYDLVIASRLTRGARNEEDASWWRPRKWFVFHLGLVASFVWRRSGVWISDVLHGFRGMRRAEFFAIEPLEEGLTIDLEMVVRSYRKRLRAIEFPIAEEARIAGRTHFRALSTGRQLLGYLAREIWRPAPGGVKSRHEAA